MSVAANLTEASWSVFNRLLDEALELPAGERLSWLEGLGAEHEALKPALRSVLVRANGRETQQWLATLPRNDSALPAVDESDLATGVLIGPYRLLRELGTGGMGTVWLAERADGTLKRQVALKLPRTTWTRGLAERMTRERDILAALEHPNIARLYDAGTDAQGRPYLALEYVEGQPIDGYCREAAVGVRERVALLLQAAQAVAFAHSRLVIHRDLKPSNILVTVDGHVRLLDFGIAKLMEGDSAAETQLTRIAGRALTVDYASPEQIRGEPIGTASDVYSMGVIAFELLTGERPYRLKRGSAGEVEEAILAQDVPLASSKASDEAARSILQGDLDAIVNKALKKSVADRYLTVDAFAQDLQHYLAGRRVIARPDSLRYRVARWARLYRRPLMVGVPVAVLLAIALGLGAMAAVTAALAVGLGAALWQARVALGARDRAMRALRRQYAVQDFMHTVFMEIWVGGRAITPREFWLHCETMATREFGNRGDVVAMALSMLASQLHAAGEMAEAMRLYDLALAAAEGSDDPELIDVLAANRAMTIAWSGRAEEARATLEAIIARDTLTPEVRHEVHHCLSSLALAQQDAPAALHHAERALYFQKIAQTVSVRTQAANIAQLGGACGLDHRTAEADRHFETAVALFQRLGADGSVQARNVLNNWSVECERAGNARRAVELADRAIALSAETASPYFVVNRARALELLGRWTDAEEAFRRALELAEANRVLPVQQVARAGLAWLALERGDSDTARRWHALDDNAPPTLTSKPGLLRAQVALRLALADGDAARAFELADGLLDIRGPAAVTARLVRARVHQLAGRVDLAVSEAKEAVRVARRLQGDNRTSARTGLAKEALAELLADLGRKGESERESREAVAILEQSVDSAHPALARARARLGGAFVREAAE